MTAKSRIVFIFLMTTSAAVAMESDSYRVEPTAISSGGGLCESTSFRLKGTVGQATPRGISSSASYTLMPGFWYQLLQLIAGGDVDGDGIVSLQDAILALRILLNFHDVAGQKGADVNGDGLIGVEEVIFILQKVGSIR